MQTLVQIVAAAEAATAAAAVRDLVSSSVARDIMSLGAYTPSLRQSSLLVFQLRT